MHLGDVARVELGSEAYDFDDAAQRPPGVGHRRDARAGRERARRSPTTSRRVVDELAAHDAARAGRSATRSTRRSSSGISIEEVVKTLIEAIALVVLVMFIFLQSWRATLIPVIAVPVVLLGTFGVLRVLGYSINTLTMFGHGALDRPARRRRDRRRRERRAPDARGAAVAARGDDAIDGARSPAR